MPPHRPRMKRLPRIAQTDEALVTYLDHSTAWLRLHAHKLYAAGFPRRDALADGWDLNRCLATPKRPAPSAKDCAIEPS
jgi:hypothetical protein